jgi:formate hydrogenlyase subunit 3/multisubunit Na+/H+ antiporter MnhD subunit
VLSAVVVKGSFFLVVRLWFDVMPGMLGPAGAQIFGALGAAAIIFGNVVALRQQRLKLLIAYSTVAQIGYLFLMFPLAFEAASAQLQSGGALTGGMLQAISHATAKGAMFMAAGLVYAALGHDRIAELGGIARAMPMTMFAFALGGVCLIGLPPSGGFLAKWLLLEAAVTTGQWWWAVVMLAGGLFTSGYMFIVLSRTLAPAEQPLKLRIIVPRYQEAAALALALASLLLGLVALGPVDVFEAGRPETMMVMPR